MRRCPFLGEFYRERRGPLRVYHFDCGVDRRSHRSWQLRDHPPICVRQFEDCPLYRRGKDEEDRQIARYTE